MAEVLLLFGLLVLSSVEGSAKRKKKLSAQRPLPVGSKLEERSLASLR